MDMFASTPEDDVFGVGVIRKELDERSFVVWPSTKSNIVAGWHDNEDLVVCW